MTSDGLLLAWLNETAGEDEGESCAPPGWLGWLGGLAECLAAERERWGLWLPVGFGSGIALYFSLASEPPLWLGCAVL
ncbi:MAG: hypothetical protein WCK65_07665, partial [Rhodospirillaceae bacterium]